MKAGPQLDALVAERVMGWKYSDGGLFFEDRNGKRIAEWEDVEAFRPTVDIRAAWQVMEKILRRFSIYCHGVDTALGFELEHNTESSEEEWICTLPSITVAPPYEIMDPRYIWVPAKTAPEAICRAALEAVEKIKTHTHENCEECDRRKGTA